MKALIISDNHGDQLILEKVTTAFANQVDLLVHCGDSELPASSPLMEPFVAVAGNNDWHAGYPQDRLVSVGGVRVFATHGHHYQVNFSLTPLMLKGEEQGADIICYGHTHRRAVAVDQGILMINPGSISLPRGQDAEIGGTFALVEADAHRFIVDYYDRQCQPVADLHFIFPRK